MSDFQTILNFQVGNFSTERIGFAFVVFIVALLIFKIFRTIILNNFKKLARKTKTDFDDLAVKLLGEIPSYFYWLLAIFIGFHFLRVADPLANKIINGIFTTIVIYRGVIFAQKIIAYSLEKFWGRDEHQVEKNRTAIHGILVFAKIILWTAGLLLMLSNLGFEVGTLVASLGISGIAIAFALQNILSDLFSSFAIYLDQPFQIGDYVVVGEDSGTIKKIGLKTTRIQTLKGDELVISNAELTSSRIHNFKKMRRRRVNFTIGVVYETASVKLQKIPDIIQKIIEDVETVDFERCHFQSFGDFSLNFETVFYVKSRDYHVFMDARQMINLGVKEAFEKAKIEMAFPTQTIYVQK